MRDFDGTTALVTGGGDGIGRALAEALAGQGARVAVTDINADSACSVADHIVGQGGTAVGYALDVTSDEQWQKVVAEVGRTLDPIDILCNNAGCGSCQQELVDTPIEYLRWLHDVNVLGPLRGIRAVVPGMKARHRGHVLFTGSMSALWTGAAAGDYCSTKHAVLAIADTLRQELDGTDVQVSIVCPAGVPTKFFERARDLGKAGSGVTVPPPNQRMLGDLAAFIAENGGLMEPQEVARISLEGMQAGRFFIVTHPGSGKRALDRNAELARELARIEG